MFLFAALAIVATMTLAVCRALAGPTIYDRVLAANVFGTKTVLFLAIVAFLNDRPDFLDLALTYALINFIGTLAVLHFFQSRKLLQAEERETGAEEGDA